MDFPERWSVHASAFPRGLAAQPERDPLTDRHDEGRGLTMHFSVCFSDSALSLLHKYTHLETPPERGFSYLGCFEVDFGFGKLGQILIGLTFFLKGCIKKLGDVLMTELGSPALQRAVAGNFVMLYSLC